MLKLPAFTTLNLPTPITNPLTLHNQEEIATFDKIMNDAYQKSTAVTKMKLTDWLDSPWDNFFEVLISCLLLISYTKCNIK